MIAQLPSRERNHELVGGMRIREPDHLAVHAPNSKVATPPGNVTLSRPRDASTDLTLAKEMAMRNPPRNRSLSDSKRERGLSLPRPLPETEATISGTHALRHEGAGLMRPSAAGFAAPPGLLNCVESDIPSPRV